MRLGLGLQITRLGGGADPFASLMSTLLSGSSQLIAHPLEYGSMFQDRAGTTPVTEPGQLVGMVLDHGFTGSKPVPTGPELVTNGGFDTDTAGWSITGDAATTLTWDSGAMVVNAPTAFDGATQTVNVNNQTSYELSADVVLNSGSVIFSARTPGNTDTVSFNFTQTGSGKFVFTTKGTSLILSAISGASAANFSIDNISVRELPGYHATAISDAARGVFREVDGIRYIEYNGVNTAYSTPALPAPGVDKAQVFAGVRKLSDAARGVVLELSPSIATNNGAFALFAPNSAGADFAFESKGTTLQSAIASGIASPATRVMTGLGDISGDTSTLRLNGVQAAQNIGDQGTGNYNPAGTYTLYSGGRAGTSLFFNGRSYATLGPISRFSEANATAAQIEAAEAYYTARVI